MKRRKGKVDNNIFVLMEIIRIGKYKTKGETIIATRQINNNADPPTFPASLRSRHCRLCNEINSELAFIRRDQKELLGMVEDWVLMKDSKAKFEGKPAPASKKQAINPNPTTLGEKKPPPAMKNPPQLTDSPKLPSPPWILPLILTYL